MTRVTCASIPPGNNGRTGTIANVSIDDSSDGGSSWIAISTSTSNDGSYTWTVPALDSANCLIRVNDTASSATGTSPTFSIYQAPSITLTAPNGGSYVWTVPNLSANKSTYEVKIIANSFEAYPFCGIINTVKLVMD